MGEKMTDTTEVIEVQAEVIEPTDALEVTYTQAIIKDNLAAIEAYVDEQIKPYLGAVIDPSDDGQIKEARKAMADLNKLKDPIDKERKRIKSEYEAPMKAFEGRVKGITGKIDTARTDIKKQVDDADETFRASRRAVLEAEFAGCTGPLEGLLSFERILDSTWLNRSTPESKALKGIQDAVVDAIGKYETLVSSGLRHKDECVKLFCETLDLKKALALDGQLAEQEREAAEFAAKRAAAEAAVGIPPAQPKQEETQPTDEPTVTKKEPVHHWVLHYEFDGPVSLALALRNAIAPICPTGGTIKDAGVIGHE